MKDSGANTKTKADGYQKRYSYIGKIQGQEIGICSQLLLHLPRQPEAIIRVLAISKEHRSGPKIHRQDQLNFPQIADNATTMTSGLKEHL